MNEAELLLSEVTHCSRASLYLNRDELLGQEQGTFVAAVLARRSKGEPIQYILEKAEFIGLEFSVTPAVFIPRPETEILVETALRYLSAISCQVSDGKVLDIGTGSGCIAISLVKMLAAVHVDAIDISKAALSVARDNALLNQVNHKIQFFQGDVLKSYDLSFGKLRTLHRRTLSNVEVRPSTYDLIVSNPPYIPSGEIAILAPELQWEPRMALDGGTDGLDFYRSIIGAAPRIVRRHGFMLLEIGFSQADAVREIVRHTPALEVVEIISDYNHMDRVMVIRYG